MTISVRRPERIVPEYSLTGDLLSHRRCGLQYRLYNRGALPPSKPVQQWFGEFIHGVMEEAYRRWREGLAPKQFPWVWGNVIQPIEADVHGRLLARGLKPPPALFVRYRGEPENFASLRRLASYRAEAAINTWGADLFPLVQAAEVRLKGSRSIKHKGNPINVRAHRYTVTGVVDVLSSVELRDANSSNRILAELISNSAIKKELQTGSSFDVIVDYKGMRRPLKQSSSWSEQAWQLQTYAWLRQEQSPDRRVIAGVLLYLNELIPARADVNQLIKESEVVNGSAATDLPATEADILDLRKHQRALAAAMRKRDPDDELLAEYEAADVKVSWDLRVKRSFRLEVIDEASIKMGLDGFDATVADIEECVRNESASGNVLNTWPERFDPRTCVACDFKYQCPTGLRELKEQPSVP